jgi:hypothetical protein
MGQFNSNVIRIYGGNPSGDLSVQEVAGPTNAGVTEVLIPGTYRRSFAGPKANGHFSIHVIVDVAGGATSAGTVWYTNHPNPSLASDSDWVQDATIGTIDLTLLGGKFINVGNVDAEYVMIKVIVATSNASVRMFVRVEGTTHGKMG